MSSSIPRLAALGASAGVAWGVLARIWMRLISEDPEFTWAGTLGIVGLAAGLGAGVGVVAAARLGGRSLWWTVAVVPGLVLFMSPGMLLAPCFLLGGLARVGRRLVSRVIGWTAIVGPIVAMLFFATGLPEPGSDPDLAAMVVGLGGFTLMAFSLAWAGSLLWQPRPRTALVTGDQGAPARVA